MSKLNGFQVVYTTDAGESLVLSFDGLNVGNSDRKQATENAYIQSIGRNLETVLLSLAAGEVTQEELVSRLAVKPTYTRSTEVVRTAAQEKILAKMRKDAASKAPF